VLLDREAEASEMRMVKEARIGVRYRDHVTRPSATNQERGERREEEEKRRRGEEEKSREQTRRCLGRRRPVRRQPFVRCADWLAHEHAYRQCVVWSYKD
jgi:hypothetical protein